MKLKDRLPFPWEKQKIWPMCGKCGWRNPMGDCDPFPCEECATKYGLLSTYYEDFTVDKKDVDK